MIVWLTVLSREEARMLKSNPRESTRAVRTSPEGVLLGQARRESICVYVILGNRYRLICVISFETGKVYIVDLLTHAEYDRGQWKLR
jgi:hypothetical protein